ncbi:hypothetical protein BZG02_06845 [Labilibaculum filiforme]|uniref:Uncharacterized protein n=1 Tax=Labilibaculum filiforme TaxID=1940526 RepID=A0A2N3I2I3_9BACT|nr:hypothetical protein [Labilibaculum filiforme]PKQ64515.1 hypothetical protein BZG02_06845 [Labilibaculum filiforme]
MDTELIQNIRKRWLFSLFEFAHIEFQERLWLLDDYPNSVSDFTEAVCKYFNDLSLEDGYTDFINDEIINTEELDIIKDFHKILDKYVEKPEKKNLSDTNILRDTEWLIICELAKSNWENLKQLIKNIDEIQYMESLETDYLNDKK